MKLTEFRSCFPVRKRIQSICDRCPMYGNKRIHYDRCIRLRR